MLSGRIGDERFRSLEIDEFILWQKQVPVVIGQQHAFVTNEEGWLVIVLHGVDGEGYGPLPAQDLGVYLDRLIAQGVQILPASTVLKQALKAQGEASA
jgi:hypothetical protein